jgi:outer membrane beta-barrel protein
VRKLRLHREGRFEVAPNVSFTLLDEYRRTIFFGMRLNYNFTDWIAVGVWGAMGNDALFTLNTGLTTRIQDVNEERLNRDPTCQNLNCALTQVNLGDDFDDQIATLDWVASPQITLVPFRGKLALFQSVFLDSDLYFFGGPAFIGLTERGDCSADDDQDCTQTFEQESRMAIAPSFGLGFTFYVNKWMGLGAEYRAMPFSWNSPGFDTGGGGQDEQFPDNAISEADQQFKFNSMLTVSWNFYFPMEYSISE